MTQIRFAFLIAALSITSMASAQTPPLQKITINYPAKSGGSWPMFIAKEGGYYQKYGLDVTLAFGAGTQGFAMITGGNAVMDGTASIEFGAAASTDVKFNAGASGTLKLADSFDFSGIVSGFNQNDHIDLLDMSFGAGTTAGYVENQAGTGGTLSVTDGAHTVNIALLGHYSAGDFTVAADHTTGTLLSFKDHLVI